MSLSARALPAIAAAAAAVLLAAAAPDPRGFVRVRPSELKWTPTPNGLGGQSANVIGDPAKPGLYVMRAKFPPYVMDRPHTHSGGDRYVTVLEGE